MEWIDPVPFWVRRWRFCPVSATAPSGTGILLLCQPQFFLSLGEVQASQCEGHWSPRSEGLELAAQVLGAVNPGHSSGGASAGTQAVRAMGSSCPHVQDGAF